MRALRDFVISGLEYILIGHVLIGCAAPTSHPSSTEVVTDSQISPGSNGTAPEATGAKLPRRAELRAPRWVERDFPRQGLSLQLDVEAGFGEVESSGGWSRIEAQSSGERVFVYQKPARRTVTLDECEEATRASLSVLRHGLDAAHERPWFEPQGYSGRIRVVLLEDGGGIVEGFSVAVSRCLSVVYFVPDTIGFADRLRQVVQVVLPSVSILRRTRERESAPF